MTFDIQRAQVLLRQGHTVSETAQLLGEAERTFRQHFTAACGMSPRAWQQAEVGRRGEGDSPVVAYRLPADEHAALVEAAEAEDMTPNEWARQALRRALQRRSAKK